MFQLIESCSEFKQVCFYSAFRGVMFHISLQLSELIEFFSDLKSFVPKVKVLFRIKEYFVPNFITFV